MALPKIGSFRYNFELKSKERLASQLGSFKFYDEQDNNYRDKLSCFGRLKSRIISSWEDLRNFVTKAWEVGRSDPRIVIFSAKLALAITIVSLLMFVKGPLFKEINRYAVWAIFTVVLIFEFSIGETFSKGFNRALGTIFAAGLSLGIAELSEMAGNYEEPIIIVSIFLAGFWATFLKLFPTLKQYEYGFRVFLVTFCLVMVAGYRAGQFIQTAFSRFLLIAIGAAVSLAVNTFIYPIWSGEDLHNLVVKNFTNVAMSLEGCVNGYLQCVEYEKIPSKILIYQAYDDPLYSGYRSVVESKNKEDSLKDFAVWEPPHGPYRLFRYPWMNYVQLSGALRHCAFAVMTMHGCILSEIQAPPDSRQVFYSELQRVGNEGAKVLRDLGSKVKKMEKLNPGDILLEVHQAVEELQKKIDGRSYLLVNSEAWEIGNRLESSEDVKNALDMMQNNKVLGTKSLSETVLNLGSFPLSTSWNASDDRSMHVDSSIPPGGSLENMNMMRTHVSRPALHSISDVPESRTYESASALSLATFASLLIEFVARLQNVVMSFEELSEKANFKDPLDVDGLVEEAVGFWARLMRRLLRFKD